MENTRWNKILISCIQKNWQNLSRTEEKSLQTRRIALNKGFLSKEDNIIKLRKINDILHKREAEIHAHANRVRKMQMQWIENNLIIDYEIDVRLQLWSSIYNTLHPDFEGNAFYESGLIHFGHKYEDADPIFINDNWNEFEHSKNHPLSKEFHCYTFHHLYDHTYLSWEDIASIEDIWIDIEVKNQFLINIVSD